MSVTSSTGPSRPSWKKLSAPAKLRLLDRLRAENQSRQREAPTLELIRQDPARVMSLGGMRPDPWQARALRSRSRRTLFLCSRSAGKSQAAAAMALRDALLYPPALVLLLSRSLRQSGELFRERLLPLWRGLGEPCRSRAPTRLELELANGSRVVSLPENESSIRGFNGVRLLVIDEAARVSDELFKAVRPMVATSRGSLVVLSTAFGKRGFFFEAWEDGAGWDRYKVTADQCPRIPPEELTQARADRGERWYMQEYHCRFNDAVDQLIPEALIDRAMGDG
jgi:hypothetical protein